jgi:hypothetical protein
MSSLTELSTAVLEERLEENKQLSHCSTTFTKAVKEELSRREDSENQSTSTVEAKLKDKIQEYEHWGWKTAKATAQEELKEWEEINTTSELSFATAELSQVRIQSTSIESVEKAELSSSVGETPITISGTAIGAGDTTFGLEKELKYWPESTLRDAAETLTGKNLVTDHDEGVDAVVGEIIESWFENGKVRFKAELDDSSIAEKVRNGRLDVSATILHRPTDELEQNDEDAYIVDLAYFDSLSFVRKPGASESNEVQIGDSSPTEAALSEAIK